MKRSSPLLALALAAIASSAGAGYVDPAAPPVALSPDDLAGRELIRAQDWAAAAAHLEIAVRSESHNADARYWLGVAYAGLGRGGEALAMYREAIALDPGHRAARVALGLALLQRGDRAGARSQLDALAKACGDCDGRRALAEAIAAPR